MKIKICFGRKLRKRGGVDCVNVTIEREDRIHVRSKDMKGVWKSHFECLMNEKIERTTRVSSGWKAFVCA